MSLWTIIVPAAARNKVKNPSAEVAGGFGLLLTSPSVSISPSASSSPSASASISASRSTSPSASTSISPSASASRSPSASSSPSGSTSPSTSVSPSPSPSAGITAVTRSTSQARFGDYAYLMTDGMTLALEALGNAIHSVSLYVTSATATTEVSLDGNNFHLVTVLNGVGGTWRRIWAQIPAAQASGSTTLYIRNTAGGGVFVDGIQVEETEYPTTYIDGDQGPLYRWTGLRHLSASTRDAQERGGGREMDLYDDYGFTVTDRTRRIGMPPLVQQIQALALGPGANHQGVKVLPREIELGFHYEGEGADDEAAWESVHSKRQGLIDLFKPDAVRGSQPVIIGYSGANSDRKVYAAFHYVSGLEFGEFLGYSETPTVRLFAEDPFWYEDDRGTASLDFTDSVTAGYTLARINRQWTALGSGFNNTVFAILADKQSGRIYFGGDFTTANGVTVNRVCYWDGSTYVALDGGVNGSVKCLAIAPNGDVWVGGSFTTVGTGAAATKGLARWNISSSTWTAFNESTGAFSAINAVAVAVNGDVWIGGNFTNWEGDAGSDNIAYTTDNGVNWNTPGSAGASDEVRTIIASANGRIYVGGFFETLNSVTVNCVGYWNGSTFVSMGSELVVSVDFVYTLAESPAGDIYIGGQFENMNGLSEADYMAVWNGASWRAVGGGLNGTVRSIAFADDGLLIVAGGFSTAGGLTLADTVAAWNGSTWVHLAVDLPGSAQVYTVAIAGLDIYLGFDTTGTATVAGATTVTPSATTSVFPDVTIIGPTSSTATLQWQENQTTEEVLYFSLAINTLETILISFQPGSKFVASLWTGRPGARSARSIPGGGRTLHVDVPQRAAGLISSQPLSNSDFASWHLLPGANTIIAFISGTTTGVAMLMHWPIKHWAADGPA